MVALSQGLLRREPEISGGRRGLSLHLDSCVSSSPYPGHPPPVLPKSHYQGDDNALASLQNIK